VHVFKESPGFDSGVNRVCTIAFTLLREKVLQDFDKWTIAAHEVNRVPLVFMRMGKAKADKSLSGAGNARQKADDVLIVRSRLIYISLDRLFG
jgi:hypothetical protein